jgi:hypothetical protein
MKFAKEHLRCTLNMDFSRPTLKMKTFAEKADIDLTDPIVLEEFEAMKLQNLEDIRRMRDGKPILNEQEVKQERAHILAKLHE